MALDGPLEPHNHDDTFLYFNSASSALKWFLIKVKEKKERRLKVGIQVLTCESVNSAIKESGNDPVYMDVSHGCYTTLLPDIIHDTHIDVLILSHLFGMANSDYKLISDWCRERQIILVNDLAQTVHAKVDGKFVEDYDDYYFYSFAFDKPMSAGSGGALKIKSCDRYLIDQYRYVPSIPAKKSRRLLRKFYNYYLLTDPDVFEKEFRFNTIIEKVLFNYVPLKSTDSILTRMIYFILSSGLNKLLSKFERLIISIKKLIRKQSINIIKCGIYQKIYIINNSHRIEEIQRKYNRSFELCRDALQDKVSVECQQQIIDQTSTIHGQRFSIRLTERESLIEYLKSKGIEAGTFNWPNLICKNLDRKNYPNALACINEIVNIPCWDEKIWIS